VSSVPKTATPFGENNTLVTTDRAEELRKRIKAKLKKSTKQLNAGLPADPELMRDATELGVFYIEGGARKFVDFARKMIEDLGDAIRPYLKSVYAGAYYYPGLENTGMDPIASIDSINVDEISLQTTPNESINKTDEQRTSDSDTRADTQDSGAEHLPAGDGHASTDLGGGRRKSPRSTRPDGSIDTADEGTDAATGHGPGLASTDTDRLTFEEMKALPYVPIEDLLTGTEIEANGERITVNAKSHEIYRRTFEEAQIQKGKLKPGSKDAENLFAGIFLKPETVKDTVRILREKANEAKTLNYSAEEIAVFNAHADALEKAAEKNGTATIIVFAKAIPHEMFHEADFLGAANKTTLDRHSKAAKEKLDVHPVRNILWVKHFSTITDYQRIKATNSLNTTLRAEIPPYLLELTDAQLAKLGITPEMRDDYMLTWFEGYVEKNGIDALDNFDREELNVQEFISEVKNAAAAKAKQDGKARKKDEADTGKQRKPGGQIGTGPPSDRGVPGGVSVGKEKFASLPETLRAAGLEADDLVYEVFGDAEARESAAKIIEEFGVAGALKFINSQKNLDVDHAMVSFMIQRMMLNQAEALKDSDPQASAALHEQAKNLARDHSLKAINAGRFTRAASIVQNSVEGVVYSIESMIKDKFGDDKGLSPEDKTRIIAEGKALEEAVAKVERLQKDKNNLNAKVKRLEDEKEGKKRKKRRASASQKNRQRVVDLVKDEKQKSVDAVMARLRARFAPAAMSAATSEADPDTLKSTLDDDYFDSNLGFDNATLNDLAEVGAMMLTEGLAGETDYLPETFKAEMIAEFGDMITPQFQEIYRRAWDLRTQWLNEIREQQTKERLENKYNEGQDLSDDEIADLLGQEKERNVRRRAIEAYHKDKAGAKSTNRDLEALTDIITKIDKLSDDAAIAAVLMAEGRNANGVTRGLIDAGITDEKAQREAMRQGADALAKAKVELKIEKDRIANEIREVSKDLKSVNDARWIARNELKKAQQTIADEMRRISTGELKYWGGKVWNSTNALRTMMASLDMSAALRQGGYFTFATPELQAKAWANMITSIGEKGYGRAIMELEQHGNFTLARRSGIDFAIAGKMEDSSDMMGEELYRGEEAIEAIPLW